MSKLLLTVARSLPEEFKDQVVSLGGFVVSLLITDATCSGTGTTRDVAMIVDAYGRTKN